MSTTTHVMITPEPIVRLEHYFQEPYKLAIATARTCYSSKVISPDDVGKDEQSRAQRDRIAESIYKAGHHTTIQHPTFQFVLEKVSRQFIWSFLHSHPFYNSEQVSQRYVEVKPGSYIIPPLEGRALGVYEETVARQFQAYATLMETLKKPVSAAYFERFKGRAKNSGDQQTQDGIKKRCMEAARYVLQVGTFTYLYHSISGITLLRYYRLCRELDASTEQTLVVQAMV